MDVIGSAMEKLSELIVQEAAFLGGYRDKVEWLKTTMQRLQCFLEDAESKGRKEGQREKNTIREIRHAAFEVDDLIRSGSENKRRRRRRRKGCLGLMPRYAFAPYECFFRHRVLANIERIEKKIRDISGSKELYAGLVPSPPDRCDQSFHDTGITLSHMEYDEREDVVGFDKDKRLLISRLLDEENKRRAICLVGMVGLGKTTLARGVYRDAQVIRHFDVRRWVTVTKNCRVSELLNNISERIIGHTMEELKYMDKEQVQKMVELLKVTKYLLVLDDVWTPEVWNQVCRILPDFENGSRIMLTTRSKEVAQSADASSEPHELHFLNGDDSWELLRRKAFPIASETACCCREKLRDVGRALAKNCGGLPLALVVLGGILLKKGPSHAAWTEVAESMDWESDKKCSDMLALSYDDLPHPNLKSCFLYIASFPESSEISASKLIDLWIAVGLVPTRRRLTLEQTARGYLDELIQRCMVQVAKRSFARRRTKSIRIHDLLRDWCNSEAKDGGFLEVFSCSFKEDGNNPPDACLAGDDERYEASCNLRSLLAFNKCFGNSGNRLCFERLSRLRALDFEGATGITDLPEDINKLIHLRYLGLRNSSIKTLPPSIGDLHYLQTLDARESEISQLPSTLWRIPTLEKVRAGSVLNPVSTSSIETSKSLQALGWVEAGEWIERWSLMEDATKKNLRKLAIASIGEVHQEAVIQFLGKLQHLSSLSLEIVTGDGMLVADVLTSSRSCSSNLGTLKLHGSRTVVDQLPRVCECARNVRKLELRGVEFSEDPMKALGELPDLVDLVILNFSISCSTVMTCSAGGFTQLRHLEVGGALAEADIEEWRVEESAMRSLTHLTLVGMKKLNQVPQGFQHLSNLQELTFKYMSGAFKDRIQEGRGQDWHLISRVSSVFLIEE